MNEKNKAKSKDQLILELVTAVGQVESHVMVTNKEGVIEYVNPAFEKGTGFSFDEAVGKSPNILKSGEHDEDFYRELWKSLLKGKEFSTNIINKNKNGDLYFAEQVITPLKDDKGQVTHFVSSWNDISAQKYWEDKFDKVSEELDIQKWGLEKTNKALRSLYSKVEIQNKELVKLDQLKSDFVSTVSHELRTPLAISTEGINLILDGFAGEVSDKQKNLLETSKENLVRLNMIINDLLDISKIEAGKIELRPVFFDLVVHLQEIVDSYQPVAAKKKLNLVTNFPKDVVTIYVDKDKITQVLTNLLSNAYKFTDEGGLIEVCIELQGTEVVCSVKDSGYGIEQENIPKLFKKFQQLGRQEGPGIKGTGLGLTICKNLIEVHDGRIWVDSEIGQGTTFHFALPLYVQVKEKFNKQFDDLLIDARSQHKILSMVILKLNNSQAIVARHDDEFLSNLMNQLLLAVTEILSYADDKVLLYSSDSIHIVLPETRLQGVLSVISRIKVNIKKFKLTTQDMKEEIDIKFGYSLFPASGETRTALVEKAEDDILRQRTILVVDDEPQVFKILHSHLDEFGYQVDSAVTGEEALDVIAKKRPDLVILDIMMGGISGYEVFGKMKENLETASIPIIILTSKSIDTVRKEAPQVGEIPVVMKSGSYSSLVDLINQMI